MNAIFPGQNPVAGHGRAPFIAHTEPLFKALDLLKIHDMLDLSTLKFYYRYVHDNLPAYFYSFRIVTQGTHHNYDTRNRDQIHIDRTRTRYADKRVRIYLPTVLNSTPTALLEKFATHSLQGFALNLKKYFIHQYSDICSIPNCYICRHNLTWWVIVATCVTFPCLFFFCLIVCLLFVCLFVFLKPSGNGGSLMYLMHNLVASTVAATKP